METCKNCGTARQGGWCHQCGQQYIGEDGRRFRHLLSLFVAELTSLDGRFWRSMLGLLRPGWLSQQYLQGRRASLLSPVSVFLLVNVLYFFAPTLNDFELPFSDQVPGHLYVQHEPGLSPAQRRRSEQYPGQWHAPWTTAWVEARLAGKPPDQPPVTLRSLAAAYDAKSAEISKLLIIVHVPFLALLLYGLLFRLRLYYAEHFVVSLHLFAGILLLLQLLGPVLAAGAKLLPQVPDGSWLGLLQISLLLYLGLALQRIHQLRWWTATLAAGVFVGGLLLINLSVYRSLQFVLVFALS